jgi:hypothetical protein
MIEQLPRIVTLLKMVHPKNSRRNLNTEPVAMTNKSTDSAKLKAESTHTYSDTKTNGETNIIKVKSQKL